MVAWPDRLFLFHDRSCEGHLLNVERVKQTMHESTKARAPRRISRFLLVTVHRQDTGAGIASLPLL